MHCMRDLWLYRTSVIFVDFDLHPFDAIWCCFAVLIIIVVGEATLSLLGMQKPFWLTHLNQATFLLFSFREYLLFIRWTRWQHLLLFTSHVNVWDWKLFLLETRWQLFAIQECMFSTTLVKFSSFTNMIYDTNSLNLLLFFKEIVLVAV